VLPVLRGRDVCCLLLPGEPAIRSTANGVRIARGDLTNAATLRDIPERIDVVVHCAALMLPNPPEEIRRVNVEGTRTALQLAHERGARRFIHFSAVSAVYRSKNVYGESKAESEALVAASGLDYTILRPTMVYGRGGGRHFQQLLRLVRRAPGAVPVLGSGQARLQPVCVDDVVRALELVLDQPRAVGRTYGVAGATVVTFDAYLDRIRAALGRPPLRKLHVPLGVCYAAARALEPLLGPTMFSPGALRGINEDATLDIGPFQRECGFAPVDLDTGLRAAVDGC
jgi:NADH dehydrogenase